MNIPREFVNYVIELLSRHWKGRLWRFVGYDEPAKWVAYGGFSFKKSTMKKLSMSMTPIFCKACTFGATTSFIEIPVENVKARAVTYTCGIYDALTGDMIFPFEFEMSVYEVDEKPYVPANLIEEFRLMKDYPYSKSTYCLHSCLSLCLHGKNYYRHIHTIYPEKVVLDLIALVIVFLEQDKKVKSALGYGIDKFSEYMGFNVTRAPCYAKAEAEFEVGKKYYDYEKAVKYATWTYTLSHFFFVPKSFLDKYEEYLKNEVEHIIDLLNLPKRKAVPEFVEEQYLAEAYPQARYLHIKYPDLFPTALDAAKFYRWQYIVDDMLIASFKRDKEEKFYGITVRDITDPIGVIE